MNLRLPLLTALLLAAVPAFAQHGHLNAGAAGTNQGDKLIWANGAAFASTSGFVRTMIYTNAGRFSNTYNQNITLTSLARTTNNGGPIANAPAPGAFVIGEIVSVQGPEGGAFLHWETNSAAGVPDVIIPSGTANAGYRYDLSDKTRGAGTPGGDPFGHIHSRRMAVTKPGVYTVGFRAIDISTNGQNGGPIHTPSDVLEIKFSSVTSFASIDRAGDIVRLTFKAEEDYHYAVEYTDELKPGATWTVATNISHSHDYLTLPIPTGANKARVYRLKVEHDPHP